MNGGPLDFTYITPTKLLKAHPEHNETLENLRAIASKPPSKCDCGMPVWKYGQCGMCFSCTTGESDASDDYELVGESS